MAGDAAYGQTVATDTTSATGRRRSFGGVASAGGSGAAGSAERGVDDGRVVTDMGNSLSWGVLARERGWATSVWKNRLSAPWTESRQMRTAEPTKFSPNGGLPLFV